MRTRLLSVLLLCVSGAASAQTRPLGLPQFAEPPEAHGADPSLYPNGVLWNTGLLCNQRALGTGWTCMATRDDVDAGVTGMRTDMDAGLAQLGVRLDALADAGVTRAQLDAAVSDMQARLVAMEDAGMSKAEASVIISTMNARIDSVADAGTISVSALAARVAVLEATGATKAELAAAVASLNTRLDTLALSADAGRTVCGSASVVGISVPLLGISGPTNIPVPSALGNRPCFVSSADTLPVAATPRCKALDGGTALTFYAAGLLSVLSIPTGTYSTCVINP